MRWQSKLDVDHPLVGVIWDVAARRRVGEAELTARVRAAESCWWARPTTIPITTSFRPRCSGAFAAAHDAPAVVFEMLDHEQQPAVDSTLRAHPGDADALAHAVGWASSGWPAWSMYRPVFETALAARGAILAAGLERAAAMGIAHEGVASLDPVMVQSFALGEPLPADLQAAMRHEMSESHCGLLPEAMLDSMVLVQRVRDALLAERLHAGAARGHGALLIAGAGHVRRDRGVPAQLARAYGTTSLAIGLVQVSAPGHDAGALCGDLRRSRSAVRLRLVHPARERRQSLRGTARAHERARHGRRLTRPPSPSARRGQVRSGQSV